MRYMQIIIIIYFHYFSLFSLFPKLRGKLKGEELLDVSYGWNGIGWMDEWVNEMRWGWDGKQENSDATTDLLHLNFHTVFLLLRNFPFNIF